MKKLILLFGLISISIFGFTQRPQKFPNGAEVPDGKLKIGSTSIIATGLEINRAAVGVKSNLQTQADSLKTAVKAKPDTSEVNLIINNINPHDSVYYKDESDSRYAPQINANLTNPTANTLPVGTNTTGLATTAFSIANGNDYFHNLVKLGSDAKGIPITFTPYTLGGAGFLDGYPNLTLVYIEAPCTITGIRFPMFTAGNYVSDNYNGIAVYSLGGTSYDALLGSTTNDTSEPNIFEAAANTIVTKAFSSPIVISQPMWIGVAFLYNSSSQTTGPALGGVSNTVPMSYSNTFTGTTFHICASGTASAITLPASILIAMTQRSGSAPVFILY